MVLELAYRLAVEDSDYSHAIRDDVITMFIPAAEPDGSYRMVDLHRYSDDHTGQAPRLYTSSGLTSCTMRIRFPESAKSP